MDAQLHNKDEGDCSVCMHHGLFGENDAFKTKKPITLLKLGIFRAGKPKCRYGRGRWSVAAAEGVWAAPARQPVFPV